MCPRDNSKKQNSNNPSSLYLCLNLLVVFFPVSFFMLQSVVALRKTDGTASPNCPYACEKTPLGVLPSSGTWDIVCSEMSA